MQTATVFVVLGSPIMCDGIRAILERYRDEFTISPDDYSYALDRGGDEIQIIVTDKSVAQIRVGRLGLATGQKTLRVIALPSIEAHEDEPTADPHRESEVWATLLRASSAEDLLEALRAAAKGCLYRAPLRLSVDGLEAIEGKTGLERLSPRELQVMRFIADGKTSKEVARLLRLRLETVRTYRRSMMKKMNLGNAAEVAYWVISQKNNPYSGNASGR